MAVPDSCAGEASRKHGAPAGLSSYVGPSSPWPLCRPVTQGFGLGWDVAAQVALRRTAGGAFMAWDHADERCRKDVCLID